MLSFLSEHTIAIIFAVLGVAEIIVRLTPTTKDDSILSFIVKIVNFLIPNFRKSGGKH